MGGCWGGEGELVDPVRPLILISGESERVNTSEGLAAYCRKEGGALRVTGTDNPAQGKRGEGICSFQRSPLQIERGPLCEAPSPGRVLCSKEKTIPGKLP